MVGGIGVQLEAGGHGGAGAQLAAGVCGKSWVWEMAVQLGDGHAAENCSMWWELGCGLGLGSEGHDWVLECVVEG